jgi:hypothetical protein
MTTTAWRFLLAVMAAAMQWCRLSCAGACSAARFGYKKAAAGFSNHPKVNEYTIILIADYTRIYWLRALKDT